MAMAAATGCSHDTPTPSPEPPVKGGEFNEFGFTTTAPVTLSVDYGDMAGMPANVYFEVYDTCPVEETETAYAKIAGVEPLYAGYTDGQGRFEGTMRTARVYPEGLCIDPRLLCAHPARSDPQRRYADRIGRIGSTCQRSPRIDARQGVSFDGCRAGRLEDTAGQLLTGRPTAASATNTTAI